MEGTAMSRIWLVNTMRPERPRGQFGEFVPAAAGEESALFDPPPR
jgi:hypothetical protein